MPYTGNMKNPARFIKDCGFLLQLQLPVNATVRNGASFFDANLKMHVCGFHYLENGQHFISVVRGATRNSMLELLAHELAHAHCREYHPKAEHHGRTFQRTASRLRVALRGWGYNLGLFYRKEWDT